MWKKLTTWLRPSRW